MKLAVNDRVSIRLPEKTPGKRTKDVEVGATILAFDLPGRPPGVLLMLDRAVAGLTTVYATREEVKQTRRTI